MVLSSIVRYADDTAGLEKLLRLFQGFCTIAAGLPSFADDLETVLKFRSQFALGVFTPQAGPLWENIEADCIQVAAIFDFSNGILAGQVRSRSSERINQPCLPCLRLANGRSWACTFFLKCSR